MQETFMMIKPDGIANADAILKRIEDEGLSILKQKRLKVDMHLMQNLLLHYQEVIDSMGKDFNFPGKLFNSFYFGNFEIILLHITYDKEEDIISKTRTLVGATNPQKALKGTIRNQFSQDTYDLADKENRLVNNVIHASDSHESVLRELKIWEAYF